MSEIYWLIHKDRAEVAAFTSRAEAEEQIEILEQTDPSAFWQIVRDSSGKPRDALL